MLSKVIDKTAAKKHWDAKTERHKLSVVSGTVGIICNIILCIFKFIIGSLTNSVSITADATNNLSDAGSNIVTIAGAKLSNKPVDKDHPFGHGRIEYISALVVAFLIFTMGFELGKSSLEKIFHPEEVSFNIWNLVVLFAAVGVKFWMGYFNHVLYKKTGNINMKAIKKDSINDAISTLATIGALLISYYTNFTIADGIIGLAVAGIIIFAGIDVVRDIMGPLLGQPPEEKTVRAIEEIVTSKEPIVGIHDLIIHDYGPGRAIASAHAEVPSDADIMEIHDLIDNIENEIFEKLNILICIHMDPIVVDDEQVNEYKKLTQQILADYNKEYSFHDFKMVKGPTHTNLIFDLVVPTPDKKKSNSQILDEVKKLFKETDSTINLVVKVEHSYI